MKIYLATLVCQRFHMAWCVVSESYGLLFPGEAVLVTVLHSNRNTFSFIALSKTEVALHKDENGEKVLREKLHKNHYLAKWHRDIFAHFAHVALCTSVMQLKHIALFRGP